jgi:hypothetical protein
MHKLLLYMSDFKLFYQLTDKFTSKNIKWTALNSYREIRHNFSVLLTTKMDFEKEKPEIPDLTSIYFVSQKDTITKIFYKTLQKLKLIENFESIIISIDPGEELTGIAVFLDNTILYTTEILETLHLIQFIHEFTKIFGQIEKINTIIKIGNGYPRLTKEFLKNLFSASFNYANIQYLLVNEWNSNKSYNPDRQRNISKHQHAAISIGRRDGTLITAENYMN